MRSVAIEQFVLPLSTNNLANFIAYHDPWYMKHLYVPFRSQAQLVPWQSVTTDDLTSLNQQQYNEEALNIPPTIYLRNCISNYVQDSNCLQNMRIYTAECILRTTTPAGTTKREILYTIPFIRRLEIGILVSAEEYRTKNHKNTRIEDILRDKNFFYQPLELSLSFTRLDLMNQIQPEIVEDVASYTSQSLITIPTRTDTFIPDTKPCQDGLHMYVQATKIDRSKLKKNLSISEPYQRIVSLGAASSNNMKFSVLIDGALFGPMNEIRVGFASDSNTNPMFSVNTFFPIQ